MNRGASPGSPSPTPPVRWTENCGPLDIFLIAAAVAYLAWVGLIGTGAGGHATADLVFEGRPWLLVTSSLDITPEFDWAQWLLLTGVAITVIYRLGPRIWWIVAIAGHLGAALVSYTAIEIATQAGSESARVSAGQADFGVSIVLAASLGALTASGLTPARAGGRSSGDRFALGAGLVGLAGMAAFSVGWYDIQHLIGYAIGFFLSRFLIGRSNPGGHPRPAESG